MHVAIYTRVSTQEQARSGLGLEHQVAACSRFVAALWPDAHTQHFTESVSASTVRRRPVLLSILRDIELFAHLVVLRLDRLSRNTRDLLELVDTLRSHDVHLHSVTERLDTDGPTGRMFLTILGATAQFERDLLAQRTSDALRAKQARGEWVGRIPFGFVTSQLLPHEKQLRRVRYVYTLRDRGQSLRAIARAAQLKVSTVRHVLTNPIYAQRSLL